MLRIGIRDARPFCFVCVCFVFIMALAHSSGFPYLTDEERTWLDDNAEKLVVYYEKMLPPLSFQSDDGQFTGLSADVLEAIEKRIGVTFEKRAASDWSAHLESLKTGESVLSPMIVRTPEREQYAFFTNTYVESHVAIITSRSFHGGEDLKSLSGRKVAVVKGLATVEYVQQYANGRFEIVEAEDVHTGLRDVSFGVVDALVHDLAVATYYIEEEGLTNLRVAGRTDLSFRVCIAVSKEYPTLFSIIEKALADISPEERDVMRRKWIHLESPPFLSKQMRLLLMSVGAFAILLVVSLTLISTVLKRQLNEKLIRLSHAEALLREQLMYARRHQELVENVNSIILRLDETGRILFANAYAQRFFGFQLEDTFGQKAQGIIFPEAGNETASVENTIHQIEQNPEHCVTNECESVLRDGSRAWILWTYKAVLDDEGHINEILCVGNDLTERKKTEENLQRSNMLTQAVMNQTFSSVGLLDLSGHVILCNSTSLNFIGYDRDSIIGLLFWETPWWPDREIAKAQLEPAINNAKEGQRTLLETIHVDKHGNEFIMDFSMSPFTDDNGQISYIIVEARDITERKKMQEKLEAEMEFNRLLLDTSPALIVAIGHDGKMRMANRAFLDLVEYGDEEAVEADYLSTFVPEEDRESLQKEFLKLICEKTPSTNENRVMSKSGKTYLIEWQGRTVHSVTGEQDLFVGVGTNITDRKKTEKELLQKQFAMDKASDNIIWVGEEGEIIYANDASCASMGYTREELLKMKVWDFDPDFLPEGWEQHKKNLKRLGKMTFETRHRAKDGHIFPVEVTTNYFDFDGRFCACTFDRDITERKQAEEALRHSEITYRAIFNSVNDAIFIHDLDTGQILDINTKMLDMFGYTSEEAKTLTVGDISSGIHPYTQEMADQWLQKALSGEPQLFAWQCKHKDGHLFWSEVSLKRGNIAGIDRIIAIERDITDRKREEEASQERSRKQSAGIVELVLDPAIVTGEISKAYSRVASVLSETIGVDRASVWMLSDDGEVLRCIALCETGGARHTEGVMAKAADVSGYLKTIYTESRISSENALSDPRTDELVDNYLRPLCIESILDAGVQVEGKLVGVISLESVGETRKWYADEEAFVSTTAAIVGQILSNANRKQVEEESKVLEAQLFQFQKMESVGRLAGGVAHDFNNMLNVILGHTELAMEDMKPDQPFYNDLVAIRDAAERSADLTRQLLAFARKQTIAPKVLDLNSTVEQMLKILGRLIGEDIDLVWRPGKSMWPVRVDPSQVDHILANLCVNACDAISGTGKVTIETGNANFDAAYCTAHPEYVPGDYVMLAVSDNGCGMDKEVQKMLFEPFFTTKGMGKGTGLGLATVYGAVRQNEGFINVYSEPGQGTTFRIYLPRHMALGEQYREEESTRVIASGTETILLVEDEPAILKMTHTMLKRSGYTVFAAATPNEAIKLAESNPGEIHLLITDVIMPEMNGRVLAKSIRTLYPNMKLLFMSGYTANVIAHHGVLDEGVFFIQKPFSFKDLSHKIREALEGIQN